MSDDPARMGGIRPVRVSEVIMTPPPPDWYHAWDDIKTRVARLEQLQAAQQEVIEHLLRVLGRGEG